MRNFLIYLFCIAFAFLGFADLQISAQSGATRKNKIKNFGSSLKRNPEENINRRKVVSNSDEDVIKVETNLVVLDCLVVDTKGNIITGLKPEDFTITEDGKTQEIQSFTLGDDAKVPRSIVLVIDYSGSQKPYIERSVEAAKLLVDKLRPNDMMAIVTDDVELIAQFTSDKKKLKKELDSLKKSSFWNPKIGESRQFSALYATLNEIFDETDIRPIVIFQTDGDELLFLRDHFGREINPDAYYRKVNFSSLDLRNLIARSRTSIYSIFVGTKLLGLSEEERRKKVEAEWHKYFTYWKVNPKRIPRILEEIKKRDERAREYYPDGIPDVQEFMSKLSEQSGGWLEFLEKPEQADGIYTRILSELNTRYIISYLPTNEAKDGKERTLKISIKNHPEYKVLGKTSYIADLEY